MPQVLVISVCLHDGRYHGAGDWPPAPARLFQALVAGAGLGGPLQQENIAALQWLESLSAPVIAAPLMQSGRSVENFMPNNDLDAKSGDPRNVGAIRIRKPFRARIFDVSQPFHYAWPIPEEERNDKYIGALLRLAEGVYQFGRGIDLAWAWAEPLDSVEFDKRLETYVGTIHRPCGTDQGAQVLACPTKGSLESLEKRYAANLKRFETVASGRSTSQSFRQPPKARFKPVSYDCPPARRLFDIREVTTSDRPYAWPLHKAYGLVKSLRDAARDRLTSAFPSKTAEIERWLIGRKPDGTNGGSPEERIRIIPLASIGHQYADRGIRRVLIEVLPNCPVRAEDVFWAFSALPLPFSSPAACLSVSEDDSMLWNYGLNCYAQTWRTVTPAALPETAARRRIDPTHRVEQAKNATERAAEQQRAAAAVVAALRHAGLQRPVITIRLQREPFESKGERAEAFAADSRFAKKRLWHIEIEFGEPASGPIAIGDGRFLGLGIMAPVSTVRTVAEKE